MTPETDASPPSLPVALVGHARRHPHRPFLFWPEGLDWRWASFAEVAAEVERLSRDLSVRLSAAGIGPGAVVAYPELPLPGRLVLDLALQAAGRVAWPVRATTAPTGVEAWVEVEGTEADDDRGGRPEAATGGETSTRRPDLAVPTVLSAVDRHWQEAGWRRHAGVGSSDRSPAGGAAPAAKTAAGGVVTAATEPDDGPADPAGAVRVTAQQLVAGAQRSAAALAGPRGAPGGRSRRDVVVVGRPLADPGERRLLAWATLTGAAVILEPSADGRVATAAWGRPTVFRGSAAEIAALQSAARKAEEAGLAGGWLRLRRRLGHPADVPPRPFRRLHTLVVTGSPPADGDVGFWRRRHVRILVEAAEPVADGGRRGE